MQTKEFRPFVVLLGLTLGLATLAASGPIYAAGHSRARTKAKHGKKASQTVNSTPITIAAPVKPVPQRVSPLTAEAAPAPAAMSSQTTGATQPTYDETVEYLRGQMGIGVVEYTVKVEDGKDDVMTKTYTYSFPEPGVFVVVETIKDSTDVERWNMEITQTIPLKSIVPSSLKLYARDLVNLMAINPGHFTQVCGDVTNSLKLVQENCVNHRRYGSIINSPLAGFRTSLNQDMDEVTQNKVLNALRHLVVLSGGKENSPDPFAKP